MLNYAACLISCPRRFKRAAWAVESLDVEVSPSLVVHSALYSQNQHQKVIPQRLSTCPELMLLRSVHKTDRYATTHVIPTPHHTTMQPLNDFFSSCASLQPDCTMREKVATANTVQGDESGESLKGDISDGLSDKKLKHTDRCLVATLKKKSVTGKSTNFSSNTHPSMYKFVLIGSCRLSMRLLNVSPSSHFEIQEPTAFMVSDPFCEKL
jgi:hypothetical protein